MLSSFFPSDSKSQRGLFLTLIALFFALSSGAELIPADRLYNWQPGVTVGVRGGIPADRKIYKTLTDIDKTGETDVRGAIQDAINGCPPGQVVQLPPGRFLVDGELRMKAGITLRGAGMDQTIITNKGGIINSADNSYHRIYMEGPYLSQTVVAGLTRGSTNVVVTNTAAYTVGSPMMIAQYRSTDQFDNPLITDTTGPSGTQYDYMYRLLVRVTAIDPDKKITFWPPLPGDMSARKQRVAAAYWNYSGTGLENFSLYLTGKTMFGIQLGGFQNSWIKGVRVRGASNYSVSLYDCFNFEVRDCSLEDLDHSGSNGAGLLLNTTCFSLFENNVILNSQPSIEVNSGSCGNVFGYNFAYNTNGALAIDSNHGPHNAYNLYEGNVANNLISDGYFGSESEGTVFRNWIHGTAPSQGNAGGFCIALKRFTRRYSIVGNLIGRGSPYTMTDDATSFGTPNMGNGMWSGYAPPWPGWPREGISGFQQLDTNVLATLVRRGNYSFFSKSVPEAESLGNETLPKSLYRLNKPAWFGELTWPPFDPFNPNPSFEAIPAGYRYVNRKNPPGTPEGGSPLPAPSNLKILPN